MMASRARLVDYEIYLNDFFLAAHSSVEYSSFYEGATETSEMARLIHANLLEGLILLGGDKGKFERCFRCAHNMYSELLGLKDERKSLYALDISIESKMLAYLLNEQEAKDYSKKQVGTFDKAMEKAGIEVLEVRQDKLPKKRKK